MAGTDIRARLLEGHVIPAHPLALTEDRLLDERHQRALTRYYKAAGAGGIAVAVHTTQFAIRQQPALHERVLRLAVCEAGGLIKIAGLNGGSRQALAEAHQAVDLGFDAGLLSMAGAPDPREISRAIPLIGFYLQEAVGGRVLSYHFWREFFDIPNVVAVKVAPFNRYRTIDVIRALKDSGRAGEIALYTGNDDAILHDLTNDFGGLRFAGGLLGQWAVWTQRVVEMFNNPDVRQAYALTDANAAIFDAAHGFLGCVPGIHEVLRRQGLLKGRWCLDPNEELSPGQGEEIDRVCREHSSLSDDAFVTRHLSEWLSD